MLTLVAFTSVTVGSTMKVGGVSSLVVKCSGMTAELFTPSVSQKYTTYSVFSWRTTSFTGKVLSSFL